MRVTNAAASRKRRTLFGFETIHTLDVIGLMTAGAGLGVDI